MNELDKVSKRNNVSFGKYSDFTRDYEYRVFYSQEDEAYIAIPVEMPDITAFGETAEKALEEVRTAVVAAIEYLCEVGRKKDIPQPLSRRKYSGKFVVRISPQLHGMLVKEAAEQDMSLNYLVNNIFSSYAGKKR